MIEFNIDHIHGQPCQCETHFKEVTYKCSPDTGNGQFQEKKDEQLSGSNFMKALS